MSTKLLDNPTWFSAVESHAKQQPLMAIGLLIAVLGVLALIAQSASEIISGQQSVAFSYALDAGLIGFAATALGAIPILFIKSIPTKLEDSMLGFAAGMMLAASAFSLILPGLAAGEAYFSSKLLGSGLVVAGIALGVLLMLGLDQFTPHEHHQTGPCGPGYVRCGKVMLFVFAIALHNLPEGMAMGVAMSAGDLSVGIPLAAAIAIQDIPEGLAVALSLRSAGVKPKTALLIAIASGLLEPVGALLGVSISSGLAWTYPVGLGLSAGAMLFVVSHEVIPETHRNGHQTTATIGLMIGFSLMMILDTALG
jgi:ZIP family zinc transporter